MYQSALPPVRPNYATANAYNPGHGGGYANDPGRFGKPNRGLNDGVRRT